MKEWKMFLNFPETYIHLYGKTETKREEKWDISTFLQIPEKLMEKLVQVKGMVKVIAEVISFKINKRELF